MAIVAVDVQGVKFVHPHGSRIWDVGVEYTTQQTNGIVKEAPGSGLSFYITDITVIANAAVTISLFSGTTVLKFKYYASAQGDGVARSYVVPKKVKNAPLTITTSAAVTVYVEVHGYTAP